MLRAASTAFALLALTACEEIASDQGDIALPQSLTEVSGLAMASESSVFAHNDEHAIIQEVSLLSGRVTRAFALGDPTIEGDFEGIATAGGSVFLITSDGLMYVATPVPNGERARYRTHDTGIGALCEIEGLSNAPSSDHLLILCKRLRRDEGEHRLEIYRWQIGTEHAEAEPWLSLPLTDFLTPAEAAELGPSGLEWDFRRQRLVVVSARTQTFMQFDLDGNLINRHQLDAARHRQTEGIAILPECTLVLADEGSETRRARLTSYPCPD